MEKGILRAILLVEDACTRGSGYICWFLHNGVAPDF